MDNPYFVRGCGPKWTFKPDRICVTPMEAIKAAEDISALEGEALISCDARFWLVFNNGKLASYRLWETMWPHDQPSPEYQRLMFAARSLYPSVP